MTVSLQTNCSADNPKASLHSNHSTIPISAASPVPLSLRSLIDQDNHPFTSGRNTLSPSWSFRLVEEGLNEEYTRTLIASIPTVSLEQVQKVAAKAINCQRLTAERSGFEHRGV